MTKPPTIEQAILDALKTNVIFEKGLRWTLYNKREVPFLKQEGPECGLVALWMAAQLIEPQEIEKIRDTAREKGFSLRGEIFSADYMVRLAELLWGCNDAVVLKGGMQRHHETIVQHLCGGRPILIPYDNHGSFQPEVQNGRRAHWGVATGVLLGLEEELNGDKPYPNTLPFIFEPKDDSPPQNIKQTYILGKQGNCDKYLLWEFNKLDVSNNQLHEFPPIVAKDPTSWVTPGDGKLTNELNGQMVLL